MRRGHCRIWVATLVMVTGLMGFTAGCGDDDGGNDNNLNNAGDGTVSSWAYSRASRSVTTGRTTATRGRTPVARAASFRAAATA